MTIDDIGSREIFYRKATNGDEALYLKWANDPVVRIASFDNNPISDIKHSEWFRSKMLERGTQMLIFFDAKERPIGQVRIESSPEPFISVSVCEEFRGKNFSVIMVKIATKVFQENILNVPIIAYIKAENTSSIKSFIAAGYKLVEENGVCQKYISNAWKD